jgi:spermidine/putrescine-binding protein
MTRILALAVLLLPAPPAELHVLTWADYFAPDTVSGFEKEAGCKVVVDYFDSSEALRAKIQGGKSGFDVVFPSDEVLPSFVEQGLLEKLDPAKVPNARHLDARFRGLPFDPKNEHSLPYMWGTTGIAYNKAKVSPPPDSWGAFWDPKLAGRVTLLDDPMEAFAAAMALGGDDPLKPTAAAIEKAKRKLLEVRLLRHDSQPKIGLLKGEIWLAHAFNTDALQAAHAEERTADIGFVIPKEGGSLWIDLLAVAKGSPNPGLAHRFIDYLLRPDVSAAISNEIRCGNPNAEARKLIRKDVLEDPLANPRDEDLARCRVLQQFPPDLKRAMEDGWAETKAVGAGAAGGSTFLLVGGVGVVLVLGILLVLARK